MAEATTLVEIPLAATGADYVGWLNVTAADADRILAAPPAERLAVAHRLLGVPDFMAGWVALTDDYRDPADWWHKGINPQ